MANTFRYGSQGTFNTNVGVRLDVDEAIVILPVDDVPLQRLLGSDSTESIKVEWLEELLTPQTVTLTATPTDNNPNWVVTLTGTGATGDAYHVRPGDVFRLSTAGASFDTQYYVNSVDPDAGTANVTAFGGAAVAPTNADTWELVGQYRNEGSDPEEARSIERSTKFNYTQWGQERVEVTRTQRKRAMYAQTDPYDHEVQKKFRELAIRYEKSLVHGVRTQSSDTKKRFMGGLLYYITTNTVSDVVANSKSAINTLVRKAYNFGGTPRTLMVSPSIKAAISANIDPTLRRNAVSDRMVGYVVDTLLTDFGTIDIVANRHFPQRKAVLLQTEFLRRRVFDGYFHEMLAKTGDRDEGQIVGEFSLEVKNETAQGILTLTDA